MKRFIRSSKALICIFLCAAITSCTTTQTFIIAPKTVDCQYDDVNYCMLVKQKEGDNWMVFSNTINGFEYTEGTQYTIKVDRKRVGEGYNYTLKEVIDTKVMQDYAEVNPLKGTAWKAASWKSSGEEQPFTNKQEIFFSGEKMDISGNAGCNRFFGTYEIDNSSNLISFGAMGSTKMMCEPSVMTQEDKMLKIFGMVKSYQIEDDQLVLKGDGGSIVFERSN